MATAPAASPFTYERPWLYPEQLDGIFCPHRYGLIEASTKTGKTAGCMVWLVEQAMQGRAGDNYWWVAPWLATSRIVFDRLRRTLPREVYTPNESVPFILLANAAKLWFKGGDHPDSLYGDDVRAAVVDEASRMKPEAWHAVRSTLTATRGPIRIIGNVKGRKNWFYTMARIAEAGGDPAMHYAKITAYQAVKAGILAAEEIEDARRQLPAAVFKELYEAEPSDDQGNPFGLEALRAITVKGLSRGAPVIWGWDLAKSVDWTVGIALDDTGAVCRFERFQKPWRESIEAIQRATGQVPALVDATGAGDPVVETLQRGTMTVRDPKTGRTDTVPAFGRFEAFKFTSTSKQQLMELLAVAVQQRTIRVPEGPIAAELEAFEYVYERTGVRYGAPSGMHDDCVIALALAVSRFQHMDFHTGDEWMRLFGVSSRGKRTGRDPDLNRDIHEDDDDEDEPRRF